MLTKEQKKERIAKKLKIKELQEKQKREGTLIRRENNNQKRIEKIIKNNIKREEINKKFEEYLSLATQRQAIKKKEKEEKLARKKEELKQDIIRRFKRKNNIPIETEVEYDFKTKAFTIKESSNGNTEINSQPILENA